MRTSREWIQLVLISLGLFLAPEGLWAAPDPRSRLHAADQVEAGALGLAADRALAVAIVTVVDKPGPSPTGDAHDYVSYARYYWPDPAKPDGLPFIRKDGEHNRAQVAAGDRHKVDLLVDQVTTLALGWSRLHREDCARRAGEWLRAWFLTPATRMKPALDYAQVRLGHDHNRGSAPGVLDTRGFAELVEALALLDGSPALTPAEAAALRAWFGEYYHWLQTGKSAVEEHAAKNNHGSWYLVQAAAIARFLGRDDEARQLCEEDRARIGWQFAADGSQPLELERVDALHYSAFNLQAQLRLALLARSLGVDLWAYAAPGGGSLKAGLDYLRPYNDAPARWPHRENEALPAGFLQDLLATAAELDRPAAPLLPRLVVAISVDQMRADYLDRFRPYFVAGGFRRLMDDGANFRECRYRHAVTITAPGHATILSGVNARVHGIIRNDWLDPVTFIQGNAVEDTASPLVGLPPRADRFPNATFAAKSGRSPRNFLGVTVGDRLKDRYGAAAKVFGAADKDRAAILLAGAHADAAYWTEEGRFVTSRYYRPELPAWVEQFNEAHGAWLHFGDVWDRLLPAAVYDKVQGPDAAPGEQPEDGVPTTFPKKMDGGKSRLTPGYYNAFDHAPWNNEMVADFALQLVAAEQLGRDDIPDLLCVGFSQTDKVGHAYGPDSHEVMDSYVRLDRTLAAFFTALDRDVGRDRYLVVLTADHGVSPLTERVRADGSDALAERINTAEFHARIAAGLNAAFGALPEGLYWYVADGTGARLNPAALKAKSLPAARVAAEIKTLLLRDPHIAFAYTREELTGPAPLDLIGERTRLSFYPPRSPDVLFFARPHCLFRALGTDHGTPYDFDSHVPLLWYGTGIRPGVHPEPVAVEDLAPTLAGLLGLTLPAEASGRRLF